MSDAEKLSMLKTIMNISDSNSEDSRLSVYLDAAKREILAWRYSLASAKPEDVPEEYEMIQIHAVVAGYSISGAENQTAHSENGISRTFKYEDMVAYIHGHVPAIVRCI